MGDIFRNNGFGGGTNETHKTKITTRHYVLLHKM